MTDSQKWRPPVVASKPSLPVARQRDVSPALRGATAAFVSPSARPNDLLQPKTKSNALGAATIADRTKREQDQRTANEDKTSTSPSPVRGRSYLLPHNTGGRNTASKHPLHRTASEIAARAASANNSPVRVPTVKNHERPQIPARSSSRESVIRRRDRSPLGQLATAETPATAHKPAVPSPSKPQLDLNGIPPLARPPGSEQPNPVSLTMPRPVESRSFLPAVSSATITRSAPPPAPPPKRQPKQAPNGSFNQGHAHAVTVEQSKSKHGSDAFEPLPVQSVPIPIPQKSASRISPRMADHSPRYMATSPRSYQNSLSVQHLADAMVASSLASSRQGSRAASPLKHQPPSLPRRRSRSIDLLRMHYSGDKKKPPLKPLVKRPMKQTLRKQSPEEEEEEEIKRGRKHIIRKHPNKHHEGDRKRWRDKVTERERKRYEGVWAANRGYLHEYESEVVRRKWPRDVTHEDMVLNVVVQEIWSRSRLPSYALEEVWDLVALDGTEKALNKEQFVVGLWLVDQRLKGRKLPVKVSPSVWASVRSVGIKVKSKRY